MTAPTHYPPARLQTSRCIAGHWTPGHSAICPECGAAIAGRVDLPPLPAERWRAAFEYIERSAEGVA